MPGTYVPGIFYFMLCLFYYMLMSFSSKLNPGDLIRVNDAFYSSRANSVGLSTFGIFLRNNKRYAWLRYPVCDVYIKGRVSQYSRHLIKKI